ncbi:MAG TPA: PAS domain S-box protein [Acidobacteriaceae bacterium]
MSLSDKIPAPVSTSLTPPDERSRSLLEALVDSSEDAIVSKDLNGIITSWNPAAERIFGFPASEMIGKPILTIIPPELRAEEATLMSRLRAGERIEHYETVRLRKNGGLIDVSLTLSPIRDRDGRVIGASKFARNISERRRAEELRSRFAAIVESSEDAILSKDLNGIINSWNAGAEHLFGYSAVEIVGQSVLRLIPKDLQHEEATILARLTAGERMEHYETVRVRKDGRPIDVSLTISPLKDRDGRIIGVSKIARDISGRKQMQRLLVQAEKFAATGRMAANIAHEINNPLESVFNLVYLARMSKDLPPEVAEYLRIAEEELGRVSHIAKRTLGYYRDSTAAVPSDMATLLDDVLCLYQMRIEGHSIRIEREYAAGIPLLTISRGEVMQVFSNLIVNSIHAMPEGGNLRLVLNAATRNAVDGLEIRVEDNGVGIVPENLPRIFEPFFTTRTRAGTGIGLWVVQQLIESRGGSLTVLSSALPNDHWTTFTVFIPYELKPAEPV